MGADEVGPILLDSLRYVLAELAAPSYDKGSSQFANVCESTR